MEERGELGGEIVFYLVQISVEETPVLIAPCLSSSYPTDILQFPRGLQEQRWGLDMRRQIVAHPLRQREVAA